MSASNPRATPRTIAAGLPSFEAGSRTGAPDTPATAKFTQEGRDRLRRRQDAIYKLENCRSLIWRAPAGPIWVASVAPDVPGYEREHWMVNCGATPYGRWTIMRTEGPAAAAHEILGGVLDLRRMGGGTTR